MASLAPPNRYSSHTLWGTLVEGIVAAKLARTPIIFHGEHGVLEERSRNIKVQRYLWSKADQLTAVADSLGTGWPMWSVSHETGFK